MEVNYLFTVVIAEKEHIDSISEYDIFLKPFIDNRNVAFCEWNPEAESFEESVPELLDTVGRHEDWRLMVICSDKYMHTKNPFNVVQFNIPEASIEDKDNLELFFKQLKPIKFRCYEKAMSNPLVKLMTYMCEMPTTDCGIAYEDGEPVDAGKAAHKDDETDDDIIKDEFYSDKYEDLSFALYHEEAAFKAELRRKLRGEKELGIALPSEIYCIARRSYTDISYDLDSAWRTRSVHQYSRFYDWNMYYDKMRYLVFDTVDSDNSIYESDYLRFLYTILLMAQNEIPSACINPNRLYRINSENDEDALSRLVVSYDEKLRLTQEHIKGQINEIRSKGKVRLKDDDVLGEYCTNISVPVKISEDFNFEGFTADDKCYGLASDCPYPESNTWAESYNQSNKVFLKFMKQPPRSIRKGVMAMRDMNTEVPPDVENLDNFQKDDIAEFVAKSERRMLDLDIRDVYDPETYEKPIAKSKETVDREIESRMSRKTTIIIGVIVLLLFLACSLPLIFTNHNHFGSTSVSLIVIGASLVILAVAGLIALFVFRKRLRKTVSAFNGTMNHIRGDVDRSLEDVSRYLGSAAGMLRGNAVLNYLSENEERSVLDVRIRKKHVDDIERRRGRVHDIFGAYLTGDTAPDPVLTEVYPYDFERRVEFPYPVPYTTGDEESAEFLEPGNYITVPVDFIRRITVKLEELYEQEYN